MNINDVKRQIKDKSLSSYYVFTGEEIEVQRIYINKIAEVANLSVVRADTVSSIWDIITRPTLFDEKHVYVVRDDKDFLSNEKLQKRLDEDIFNGNILIMLLTNVDKRTKFYKSYSERIIVFERLSSEVLKKYVKQAITLNNANCERFIAICENDYSRILLEIDKIKHFIEAYKNGNTCNLSDCSPDTVFNCLVSNGVIYTPPNDAIFDLVDAILLRQPKRVYNLLQQCYAVGEANMVILTVLYNNAKQVLQVQSCDSKDIAKSTGLNGWQIKCAKERAGHYRIGELVNILRLIQKIQKGIVTGQMEDSISVEYLLVNIL